MTQETGPAQCTFLDSQLADLHEQCFPHPLGAVPRLGLGSRTTVLGWPVIFQYLSETGIHANATQNSVARELIPQKMLHDPGPRPTTPLPGLGAVEVGHTGSSIEGLVQWGAVCAAKAGYTGSGYGADADHLPVYHPHGPDWAKTVDLIHCAREYTHFTLDLGFVTRWDRPPVERLSDVPSAVRAALEEIRRARADKGFDLELSLDESPQGITAESARSTPEEIDRLLDRLAHRERIDVHYVAPHLGFHKGGDATDQDALAELAAQLHEAAASNGAFLSIHSGDHLCRATRQTLGAATNGNLLFKVAPAIQDLLVEAVLEEDKDLAGRWQAWVSEYLSRSGSEGPFRRHAFAAFGLRNAKGAFEAREAIYAANAAAKETFQRSLATYLRELAQDLFATQP